LPWNKKYANQPRLEKKLNTKINLTGDHPRISTYKSASEINMKLVAGHFDVDDEQPKPMRVHGIAYKTEKQIVFYMKDEHGLVPVYDGQTFQTWTREQFKTQTAKPQTSKYTLVPYTENKKKKSKDKVPLAIVDPKDAIKAAYTEYITTADTLKEKTDGKINLYKTGTFAKTALKAFADTITPALVPDPIGQMEAIWIDNASFKAMIWANQYKGDAYKYDFVSMYPSCMASDRMKFPIRKGTFTVLTQAEFDRYEDYAIPYGICC
jgi:hypothetical protein